MTFSESVKTVVLKKYGAFEGRASRSEYWWFYLFCVLIQILSSIIFFTFSSESFEKYVGYGYLSYNPIELFMAIILLIPSLAVHVRRLHDSGKSGWWLLSPLFAAIIFGFLSYILDTIGLDLGDSAYFMFLIPMMFMVLYLYYLMLKRSDSGENKYGHNACLMAE
jgi:uncharacterized membrane protein YhaH (DUF805 family)